MSSFTRNSTLVYTFSFLLSIGQLTGAAVDLDELFSRANQQLSAGQFTEAAATSKQILLHSLNQLGAAHLELVEYPQAEKAFEQALALAPSDAETLRNISIIRMRLGEYEAGIESALAFQSVDPENAEAAQLLGKIYYLSEDYAKAARYLEPSYRGDPENLSVAYTLALAYLYEKRLDEANHLFERLIQQRGDSAALRILLGRAYRETADSMDTSYTTYLARAIAEFKAAIELNPRQPRSHYYLALTYLKQEGITWAAQAIKELQTELEGNPDHFFSHYYLGLLFCQNRQYVEALAYLNRAKQLNPKFLDTDLLIGRSFFWLERYEDCVEVLSRLAKSFLGEERTVYHESNVHYLLGRALLKLNRRDEAQEHLKKAGELKRRWASSERKALLSAGSGVTFDTNLDIAEDSTKRIILTEAPPEPARKAELEKASAYFSEAAANGYQLAARAAAAQNRFDETAESLRLAMEWAEPNADLLFNRGVALFKAEQLEAASEVLVDSLDLAPSHRETNQLLAQITVALIERKAESPALRAVDALLKHHPEVPDLYFLRARIHFQKNDWQAVASDLEQAVKLNPQFADAFYQLANAYSKLGRPEDSTQALARYRELKNAPQQ